MRIFITSLFMCLCTLSASAQGKYADAADSVQVRIVYRGIVEHLQGLRKPELWCLDIGRHSAIFYPHTLNMYRELSAYSTSSEEYYIKEEELAKVYGSVGYLRWYYMVNSPESGMYTSISSVASVSYAYNEPLPKVEWQLCDSIKTICEYTCHKAVAKLYGRTWSAWYTEDIPMSYGPYILSGLPGLVLAASEDEGHFSFEAESIGGADGVAVEPYLRGVIPHKCNRAQFMKLRTENDDMTLKERSKRAFIDVEAFQGKDFKVLNEDGVEIGDKVNTYYYFDKE